MDKCICKQIVENIIAVDGKCAIHGLSATTTQQDINKTSDSVDIAKEDVNKPTDWKKNYCAHCKDASCFYSAEIQKKIDQAFKQGQIAGANGLFKAIDDEFQNYEVAKQVGEILIKYKEELKNE
jgi:hypothetical protein